MGAQTALSKDVVTMISEAYWDDAGMLPCVLSVDLLLKNFTVRDLLRLAPGTVLESENASGADVPLAVNTQIIGWAEFEVVGDRIAVRVTELA
jgi:flagellar motor switch/type III secretory pathway protein FliN